MNMRLLAMVLVLATVRAAASAEDFQLPLTVEEPAGLARSAVPASGGIPLPAGRFKADQPFALFDADGKEVPVQAVPLVVDENGFVRWLLIDLQTELPARGAKSFTLKAARPTAAPARPLSVKDDDSAVTIDTGKISFAISKRKPGGLFESVSMDGKPVVTGGAFRYTDGFDGKTYVADVPASVVVEYAGPLRATVCIRGRFVGDEQSKLGYIARVTAWAGRSDVHVKYSLANSNEEHFTFRQIKDSTLELKLAARASGATVGLAKPADFDGNVAVEQGLRKSVAGGARVLAGDKVAWSNAAAAPPAEGQRPAPPELPAGWMIVKGAVPLTVADLHFVDNPARRLAVAGDSLLLCGVIERFGGEVTDPLEAQVAELNSQRVARPSNDEEQAKNKELDTKINALRRQIRDVGAPYGAKNRWLFDCSHLSSQYVIDFGSADPAAAAALLAEGIARPHVLAPPAWYFDTEALPVGRFGTQADELKCYDLWGWKYDPKQVPTAPAQRMQLGRYVAGEDNHYETEQDSGEALLLMYLRTGRRPFLDSAETWTNYTLDLQTWRTNGWRFKDGGVWWTGGGPIGNSPQRAADPVTGTRNSAPAMWTRGMKTKTMEFNWSEAYDLAYLANSKMCYCHNWGEGLVMWFCITGDRDAFEAAIDCVEQNYDTQKRAFKQAPGKASRGFSRDFTRACYLTNATRLIAPADPYVVEASDYLTAVFLQRPEPEPRGFLNGPGGALTMKTIEGKAGPQGVAEMNKLGVTLDEKTGELTDPKSGAKWQPLVDPHTWMFPPLSRAMETYYRITGNEDAGDWLVAYGQAVAHVLFQPKHGNLSYGNMIVDFPLKGVAKDRASWALPEDSVNGEGNDTVTGKPVAINGYLAQFYPDVVARAYELIGNPFLKQRAYDFWYWGSHRGYNATKMHNLGGVGTWVNVYGVHNEQVCFTGKTFYIHAHPRADAEPPAAVADLAVAINGDKATVSFTAPADNGGGKVVRYQVKCAARPIAAYDEFLKAWAANEDARLCNWWMASNVQGEPTPGPAGQKVSFEVTGVPADAKFFTVVSYDDSNNRSALSNLAEAK